MFVSLHHKISRRGDSRIARNCFGCINGRFVNRPYILFQRHYDKQQGVEKTHSPLNSFMLIYPARLLVLPVYARTIGRANYTHFVSRQAALRAHREKTSSRFYLRHQEPDKLLPHRYTLSATLNCFISYSQFMISRGFGAVAAIR